MDALTVLLNTAFLGKAVWIWLVFVGVVVTLLALDLGVLHKHDREIGVRESLLLSAGYISIAVLFGIWVWWFMGAQSGTEYFTGFLIEKSLSMDNVFVIALIFGYFAIPRQYQHRVLFWGILGVIVLRALMIGLGAALITHFSWVLYLFGAFLVFTGIKMWAVADHMPDIDNNPVLRWLRRHLRVTPALHGNAFFVQQPDPVTSSPCAGPLRCSWRSAWSRSSTWCLRWTRYRRSLRSRATRSSSTPATSLRFWGCARSTLPWPR